MNPIDIAKTYIKAAQTGDQATLTSVISPEVVWHQPGSNQFSGTHKGIAAVGPMLGLLGTVFGMIGAFQTIGTLEGAARSNKLAEFMSLALINTAEGLMVAIPCTVAFAVFRRRIDRLGADAGVIAEELAGLIEQGAGAESPGPARQPTGRVSAESSDAAASTRR